jgi:sec-independent protein translocase protein TatA
VLTDAPRANVGERAWSSSDDRPRAIDRVRRLEDASLGARPTDVKPNRLTQRLSGLSRAMAMTTATMTTTMTTRAMSASRSTRASARRGVRAVRTNGSPILPTKTNRGDTARVNSIFGVGAPEAMVVGVVALLVFGPSGLADIAKQLGATIREFQPTIKELQDVSKEFQDTLRDEIEKPLEEATAPSKRQAPVGEPVAKKTNENVKFDLTAVSGEASGDADTNTDTVTDEMKAASAAAAWGAADAAATDAMDVADVADAAADMADIDVGADDMDAGGAHM